MPFHPIDIKYKSRDGENDRGSYESNLDLNEYCIPHPASTFFVKTESSMQTAGIGAGDLLVVDRAAEPSNGRVVVAVADGEFFIRTLVIRQRRAFLLSETNTLEITSESGASIWGIVIGSIRKF